MTNSVHDYGYLALFVTAGTTLIMYCLACSVCALRVANHFPGQGLTVGLARECLYVPILALVTSLFMENKEQQWIISQEDYYRCIPSLVPRIWHQLLQDTCPDKLTEGVVFPIFSWRLIGRLGFV